MYNCIAVSFMHDRFCECSLMPAKYRRMCPQLHQMYINKLCFSSVYIEFYFIFLTIHCNHNE